MLHLVETSLLFVKVGIEMTIRSRTTKSLGIRRRSREALSGLERHKCNFLMKMFRSVMHAYDQAQDAPRKVRLRKLAKLSLNKSLNNLQISLIK